ncbi:MAG TPA: glucosamine-6-phosphate deaminase [Thermoanaerobaculia bacterium]|nr:glucosamine-6-phosphate deaminase [Thermoanaerobaculia bacterium]
MNDPSWRIVEDYDALSREAAAMFLGTVEENPRSVLLLPTGSTPEGMYRELVDAWRARRRSFRRVTTFNLDEYVGIPTSHRGSYRTYMQTRLFDHVDIEPARAHVPDGLATEIRREHPGIRLDRALELECDRYEKSIRDAGGIDVAFLGLGRNGHIGFNEPGSPFDSRTRVVRLHESTRRANAPWFEGERVPERAITAGIATILDAKSIVLMASGTAKADAIARLARGEVDPTFPASALLAHPRVLFLIDRDASSSTPALRD